MPAPEVLTPEQVRERLEADVLAVALAVGDPVFSRPHLLQRFTSEALDRILLFLLGCYADPL